MTWKTCLIRNQILSLFLLLGITSCASGPVPKWDGKIYMGDSAKDGVTHGETNEFISARDPAFDQGVWISRSDMRSFYDTYVLGCEKWRSGIKFMSPMEAYMRFHVAMDDLKDAASPAEKK